MRIIHIDIPTRTYLGNTVKLQEGIYCFRSNSDRDETDIYCNKIGVIIDINKFPNYSRPIIDFITILNVFRQEYVALNWLSRIDYKSHIKEIDGTIEEYISSFHVPVEDNHFTDDLNEFQIQTVATNQIHYSVIEVFNHFLQLDSGSFFYNSFKFLAATSASILNANRIYDNVYYENAILFQLFEATMLNYEKRFKEEPKSCETCKKSIKMGLNRRIDRFMNYLQVTDHNHIKVVKVIAETRHKFFHSLSGLPTKEYTDIAFSKSVDNYISLEDELKYAEGTLLGKRILKQILILYLTDNILNSKESSVVH